MGLKKDFIVVGGQEASQLSIGFYACEWLEPEKLAYQTSN